MFRTAFTVALAALIATPVAAADQSGQSQPAAKAAKEDKVICKFINSTGSRLSRERECKPRSEWERDADNTRDDLEHERRTPGGSPQF
jgi:hypothetical protein